MTVQEEIEKRKDNKAVVEIGRYVLTRMDEDEYFRNAWERKKRTLDKCLRYARHKAQDKYLNGNVSGSVCVEDSEVFE